MRTTLLSSPILIKDGNFGEFENLPGVMKVLMSEVVKCLQLKGREFLNSINIEYKLNNPFDIPTKRNRIENLYDVDEIGIKIESFCTNAQEIHSSYYLRLFYTTIENNKHKVLYVFRIADHDHDVRRGKTVIIRKGESYIKNAEKMSDLVAENVEEIRKAIYDAVQKLNSVIKEEEDRLKSGKDEILVKEMISEVSELSKGENQP